MALLGRRSAALTLAAAVAAASTLAGCGSDDKAGGGDGEYNIFAMAPLSGPLATAGAQVKVGLEAAVEVLNANGGIDGRHVSIQIKDNAGDPTQVAANTQEVIQADPKPDLIMPGLTSTEAVAALPLINQMDILGTGPAASTEMAEFDRFISATPTARDASRAALQAIADTGAKKVAVLVVDNVSGESAAKDFADLAGDVGLTITGSEKISPDATDASAQLEKLRSGDADVFLWSGFSPVIGPVLKSKDKIGWDIPSFADQTVAAFPYTALIPADLLKDFTVVVPSYVVQGSEAASGEAMTTAVAAIEKAYGKDLDTPIQAALHTYMSLILVKYATEKAGSDDAMKIWEARKDLTQSDMPLYTGSSELFSGDAVNWPNFPPTDWTPVIGTTFDHGLIVPQS